MPFGRRHLVVLSTLFLNVLLCPRLSNAMQDTTAEAERLRWFQHDKFGMFIHWGPYSYLAGEWQGHKIPVGTEAEWIMQRFNIPVADYRAMAHQLNPIHFNAEEWVALAKATGMKYLVITAKHHDGFAMYKSQVSNYNIVDWTAFHRDPVAELAESCRKAGIRFGVYYSHREDWDHPDGYGNNWDYPREKKKFTRYLEQKSKPQLRELLQNYGPIALVWFDRGMDTPAHTREFIDLVHHAQPQTLINGRVGSYGDDLMGDYQNMNDNGMPTGGLQEYWETPQTLNTTWGFSKFDQQWKTPGEVIRRLVEIVSKGGNYLLNIGPMADGTIPPPSVATLQAVGDWMQRNGESIYGTAASPLADQPWGRTTAAGNRLYLHVFTYPADRRLRISGLETRVLSAQLLSDLSTQLPWSLEEGTPVVQMPPQPQQAIDTVVVLTLDGPAHAAPIVLTQASDAPLLFDYASAITTGKAVKRFNRDGKFHISKWTGPDDRARWELLVSQTGSFHVKLRYSARAESAGASYTVRIGDRTLHATVQATGEGYRYNTFDLGTVRLIQPGRITVELSPAAQTGRNLMYFQSLEIVPAGFVMVE